MVALPSSLLLSASRVPWLSLVATNREKFVPSDIASSRCIERAQRENQQGAPQQSFPSHSMCLLLQDLQGGQLSFSIKMDSATKS